MGFPVVERLVAAINTHDLDAMLSNFAPDVSSEWPAHPARSFDGAEKVRENWSAVFARFPDIRVTVTGSATVGNEFWGEWHYVRPGAADLRGVIIIVVDGDLIVRTRFYMEEVDETAGAHPMPNVR